MSITFKMTLAVATLAANMAFGAITADDVLAKYKADGFSNISIKSRGTQIKIEAIKNGQRVEVIYDVTSGAAIKTSTYPVTTAADGTVLVREDKRGVSDDGAGHDANDDHGVDQGDDHASGHDSGDDSSSHDSNDDDSDDHGGGDRGGDDHGGDDHGGDDHGGDDHGGDDHGGRGKN